MYLKHLPKCLLLSTTVWFLVQLSVCSLSTGQDEPADNELKFSGRFHVESGTNTGFLIVKLDIPESNHIYGLNQKSPLIPSKLVVEPNDKYRVKKSFKADTEPEVVENDPVFEIRVEKHSGSVQFYVPFTIDPAVRPETLHLEVKYSGQMCSDLGFCKMINNQKVVAKFAGYFEREAKKLPTEKNPQK